MRAPQNVKDAVKLLGTYTAGRFDIWMLSGSSKASCRAHVMSVLQGSRVPQSEAGVNAMREAFYAIADAQGDCLYLREESFLAWAKALAA